MLEKKKKEMLEICYFVSWACIRVSEFEGLRVHASIKLQGSPKIFVLLSYLLQISYLRLSSVNAATRRSNELRPNNSHKVVVKG